MWHLPATRRASSLKSNGTRHPHARYRPALRPSLEGSIAGSHDLKDVGIVLSLRDDQVWASWRDARAPVMLGDHGVVLAAMRDFIRQSELGERLMKRGSTGHRAQT